MGCVLLFEDSVWDSYMKIPDIEDRDDAWEIITSLVDDPAPMKAVPNTFEYGGLLWPGLTIDLPSKRGFVPYILVPLKDTGEEAVRLFPVVWCDWLGE